MTRILATGDFHCGVPSLDLAEQEKVWHRIVDAALENDVDLFLHGGDVFEGPVVTPEQMRAVLNPLRRLIVQEIPILIISGNGRHDLATREVNALDILREVPGIEVSDVAGNQHYPGCVISTLPWTKRVMREDQATELVSLAAYLHSLASEASDRPNILFAHWSISSASLPNGLPVSELREPVLEWADLDAVGFDAIVAAHIHKPQRLDDPELGDATMGVYVGSPQPLNHGEAGYEHGAYLLDVEGGAVSLEFLPIESPQFLTFDIDITGESETSGLAYVDLGYAANGQVSEGDIVRVRIRATREQDARIDKDLLRRELLAAGASRVTIEPQVTREVRARVQTITQDLGPVDAIKLYVEAQGIEPAMGLRMGERLRDWMGR